MGIISSLIAPAINLGTNIYGQIKEAKDSKRLRNAQQGVLTGYNNLSDWYQTEANKDFLDTDTAKSTLAKVRDQYQTSLADVNDNMAKGGATDEAAVAAKTGLNDQYAHVLNNLVGYGTQYKSNMMRDYGGNLGRLSAANVQTYMPDIQSDQNLISNSGKAFSNSVANTDWDKIFGK